MNGWLNKTNNIAKKCQGIYIINNTKSNKVYIGVSTDLRGRLKTHYHKLNNNKHHNKHLQHSVNKYGISNFNFEILEYTNNLNDTELLKKENKYQQLYKSTDPTLGYNICITDAKGKIRHTEEYKKYMSGIMKNRVVSEETRIKLSKAMIGKCSCKHTEQHKQYMSDIMKNRVISDETRRKQSQAKMGKPSPNKGKPGRKFTQAEKDCVSNRMQDSGNPRAVSLIDNNGNKYSTIKEATVILNCSRNKIEKLINNGELRRVK